MNDIDVRELPVSNERISTVGPSPRPSPPISGERENLGTRIPWLAIALFMALFFWASAFTAIRVGLHAYSPWSLALLRFLTASLAMAAIAPFVRVPLPTRRQLPLLFLAAIAGIPVYHCSLNFAEVTVGAGPAAMLINTSPVMAALLAGWMLRERLGPLGWVGTGVSFAGAAVIGLTKGGEFDPRAAFVLVAAAAGAIYTVLQKPLLRTMSPVGFTAWAIWIGTACLLPFFPRFIAEFRHAPASSTLAGAYMGVFPSAISYAMWAKVVSRMNVSRAVSFLYLTPVLAVIIAGFALGEIPTRLALFGGALVIGGVVLVNVSKSRPTPKSDSA